MNWGMVSAMTGIVLALVALNSWCVRAMIESANERQLRKINGTYVRSAGSTMTGSEIERMLLNRRQEAIFRQDLLDALRTDFKSRGGSVEG